MARSIVTFSTASAALETGISTGAGPLDSQAPADSQIAATASASSQFDFPVCLRLKTPPKTPEQKIMQLHFFHPLRRSSNWPERVSSE